ncbi:ABC-ATPase domain-containing protein [Actinomyces wuliandei]|uniref:ABC-ATPase domain-containing protein n=1 Tax=Actinomyces wuliandei TaxID=2057743 RepID=UPI001119C362|nr:ABC-ATPase domain-containing protein [Actinomyces wuliandei]
MRDAAALGRLLVQMDGQTYSAYKRLAGSYQLGPFRLDIDHVQVDPYAPPSRMRLSASPTQARLPARLARDTLTRTAVADFLLRRLAQAAHRLAPRPTGTGSSGIVTTGEPGQEILERTSIVVAPEGGGARVEARLEVGLPASGRRIRGREAARLLTDVLPQLAEETLVYANLGRQAQDALDAHVEFVHDQEYIRSSLPQRGLVAFVGDGAVLPRRSGDSDLPLTGATVVPFASPPSLRTAFDLPSGRRVEGMGIPEGVTVIIGGGYHGKSTLLRALERGVYPHVAGDGREWVVTRPDAVTVRAEDGRAVTGVDISPFISNLPSGTDTRFFSTTNASGSTSQAANLVEAVDAGASVLLIDEDTSATNFMIRDEQMRAVIPVDQEPITPFVERVRPLLTERGVSTILVAGGSGAFFDVADHVIAVNHYRPSDVTREAREVAEATSGSSRAAAGAALPAPGTRRSVTLGRSGGKPAKVRGRGSILYSGDTIDLAAVPQLVDAAQTQAVAWVLDRLPGLLDQAASLPGGTSRPTSLFEAVDAVLRRIDRDGLDWLSPYRGHPGHLTRPRRHELHAAVNRYRRLGARR